MKRGDKLSLPPELTENLTVITATRTMVMCSGRGVDVVLQWPLQPAEPEIDPAALERAREILEDPDATPAQREWATSLKGAR